MNFAQTSFITERPVTYYFRTLLPLISSGHPGFADGRDIVDFHDLMSPSFRQISRCALPLCVHQAQFVVGEIGGFVSAVNYVMAPVAGNRRLSIVRLASCAARTRQAVMRQHAGFRVAVAVTRIALYIRGLGPLCEGSPYSPHILLRQRVCRGGFLSSTSCALTVHVIKSGFNFVRPLRPADDISLPILRPAALYIEMVKP